MYEKALKALGMSENVNELLDAIREEKARYCKDQFGVILSVTKDYNNLIVKQALEYCVKTKLFSAGMFKGTLKCLRQQKKKDVTKKYTPVNISTPSRYQGLKP